MTPAEKDAIETAVNGFLQNFVIVAVISWWVWWLARKAGIDRLFSWPTREAPAPSVSRVSPEAPAPAAVGSAPPNLTECNEPAERTNERERSPLVLAAERLQHDRTRRALIAVLVEAGWKTVDIRDTLKGTAAELGEEIRTARSSLAEGADLLLVRDGHGERLIPR
jgi:hypothetical protein